MPSPRAGCAAHLPVIAALFVLAAVLLGVRYGDVLTRAFRSASAMDEGAEEARRIRHPDSLAAYVARHPERAALVAFDTADPAAGLRLGADPERAAVGLPVLVLLAEYARQVGAGEAARDDTVPRDDVEALFLPVRRGAAPDTAFPARVPLATLAEHAARGRDDAADALLDRLGPEAVARLPERLGLAMEPPLPQAGLYLLWADTTLGADRPAALAALSRDDRQRRAQALARRLRTDAAFREAARQRFRREGIGFDLPAQRAAAAATLPRGSADAYARLLAGALAGDLGGPEATAAFREVVERPIPDTLRMEVEAVGSVGRAFPGHVAFAGYARRADGGARVVVLLLEDLPTAVFYHLTQSGLDAALVLRLLGDPAYGDALRQRHAAAGSDGGAVASGPG